jgi:hypothetical protein
MITQHSTIGFIGLGAISTPTMRNYLLRLRPESRVGLFGLWLRQEPEAKNPLVRICGGGMGNHYPYSDKPQIR